MEDCGVGPLRRGGAAPTMRCMRTLFRIALAAALAGGIINALRRERSARRGNFGYWSSVDDIPVVNPVHDRPRHADEPDPMDERVAQNAPL
jgi:hypothetical protein